MRKLVLTLATATLAFAAQGAIAAYGDHATLSPKSGAAVPAQRAVVPSASTGATAPFIFDDRDPHHAYMPDRAVRQRPGGGDATTEQFFRYNDSGIPK
jgi:hypothetical protein